jgi:hypothetical protein
MEGMAAMVPVARTVLAPQQVASLLECVICLEYYDDPWLCSDGFVYCRECIGRWIGDGEEWISPRTNLRYTSSEAFLARDVARACAALECKHAAAAQLVRGGLQIEPVKGLRDLVLIRHKGIVAALPETVRAALDTVLRPSPLAKPLDWAAVPSVVLYSVLELAVQAGRVAELLDHALILRRLLLLDARVHEVPFVAMHIWSELLQLSLRDPCADPELLDLLWHHYSWRCTRRDAVCFTPEALASRGLHEKFEGVYARSSMLLADAHLVAFECSDSGARFYASQAPSMCPTGEVESRLQLGNSTAFFTSQSRGMLPGEALFWALRRGVDWLPVFPDAGSEEDACVAPPSVDPELADALSHDLAVLEKRVVYLPRHVEYLSAAEAGESEVAALEELRGRVDAALSNARAAVSATRGMAAEAFHRRSRRSRRKRPVEAPSWPS